MNSIDIWYVKVKNSPGVADVLKLTHILSTAKFIKCLNKDVCQCTSCAKNEAEKRKLFANGMDLWASDFTFENSLLYFISDLLLMHTSSSHSISYIKTYTYVQITSLYKAFYDLSPTISYHKLPLKELPTMYIV